MQVCLGHLPAAPLLVGSSVTPLHATTSAGQPDSPAKAFIRAVRTNVLRAVTSENEQSTKELSAQRLHVAQHANEDGGPGHELQASAVCLPQVQPIGKLRP
jgi:hypothetical protein